MELTVNLATKSYPIIIKRGLLNELSQYLSPNHYIIISDKGVPKQYIDIVAQQLNTESIYLVKAGEQSKSLDTYQDICRYLLSQDTTRKTILIALGGGVIGDLVGFVAATYLRGLSFINIPTTTLSQIDSSIGGKTAINFEDTKNTIGAFHHPNQVLIDPNTLQTLPLRHYYNGLIEAFKMSVLADKTLYQYFIDDCFDEKLEEVLYRSLLIKKNIVEIDEFENNQRKLLNLGHTLGHGLESYYGLKDLYHGEAVLVGMIKIIKNEQLKSDFINLAKRFNINIDLNYDVDEVMRYVAHDKKRTNQGIVTVNAAAVGEPYLETIDFETLKRCLEE